MLVRKGMQRREWTQFLRRECRYAPYAEPGFTGWAGVLHIREVSEPFVRGAVLADAGYTWLQLAPAAGHWWLTAMFDPRGEIVQYYFDITWRNFLSEEGEPSFEDLYLDIVMRPDGSLTLLDKEELVAAWKAGEIDADQRSLALREADWLWAALEDHEAEWRALCGRALATLEG